MCGGVPKRKRALHIRIDLQYPRVSRGDRRVYKRRKDTGETRKRTYIRKVGARDKKLISSTLQIPAKGTAAAGSTQAAAAAAESATPAAPAAAAAAGLLPTSRPHAR